MSLFKLIHWYSYQCPDPASNYDSFALNCARLNAENEQQKDNIIVTSHSGHISILQPSISDVDSEQQQQQTTDAPLHSSVVYEAKLNEPILGVLCGNFMQYTQKSERQNVIAILHPMKLVIYSLVTSEGFTEYGQQSKLQMLHQHDLGKSAFTFCMGNFGKSSKSNREYICVMFMDGSLKFFEQDGITQSCQLPGDRSIPTSFVYIARTDCFVLLAPNWDLECYRYLSLSESCERKFSPIWSLNVGEYILDMSCHQISNSESLIVLLGENNLLCLSDVGKMKFIKKLDYTPICFCSFTVGWYWEADCKLMIAVATENRSVLIYQHSTLVWCAELLEETIALRRGNFAGLAGGLVTLTATGKVSLCYFGSDPHIFKVPPLNLSKLDYEKSKTDLEEMEKEISSSVDNSDVPFINAMAEKDLQIKSHLQFDALNDGEFGRLLVKLQASVNLEQLQLFITSTCTAFVVPGNVFFFKDLPAHEKYSFETTIYASESEVSELFSPELTLVISFINKQSIARVLRHRVEVPLKNVVRKAAPQKDGLFKLILAAMPSVVELPEVFSDLPDMTDNAAQQAMALKILNSEQFITIVLAKNSNRYRLQSNSLVALAFILNVLTNRLTARDVTAVKSISVKSIPSSAIDFLLSCIEKHHQMKSEMNTISSALNSKAIEMRLFERCFLVKMQGKAPAASMDGINMLLRDTYSEILALSNRFKELKNNFSRVQIQLTSTVFFMRKAIEYADLPKKIIENLLCIMKPGHSDWQDQSWIEASAPFVDYLYNMYQAKLSQNQFYENITFRHDKFSLTRYNKQLKHILSVLHQDSSMEQVKSVEKTMTEETSSSDAKESNVESEWSSQTHL